MGLIHVLSIHLLEFCLVNLLPYKNHFWTGSLLSPGGLLEIRFLHREKRNLSTLI